MRWGDQNLIPMCLSIATIEKHTQRSTLDSLLLLGACFNVFIYSYNRKTHSTYSALQLTGVQKNVFIYSYHIETHYLRHYSPHQLNVFLYGRTTRTRTGNWQIKSLL